MASYFPSVLNNGSFVINGNLEKPLDNDESRAMYVWSNYQLGVRRVRDKFRSGSASIYVDGTAGIIDPSQPAE